MTPEEASSLEQAKSLMAHHQPSEALAILQSLWGGAKPSSDHAEIPYLLAVALLDLNRPQEAMVHAQEALSLCATQEAGELLAHCRLLVPRASDAILLNRVMEALSLAGLAFSKRDFSTVFSTLEPVTEALRVALEQSPSPLLQTTGPLAEVSCRSLLAQAHLLCKRPEEALAHAQRGLFLAEQSGYPATIEQLTGLTRRVQARLE